MPGKGFPSSPFGLRRDKGKKGGSSKLWYEKLIYIENRAFQKLDNAPGTFFSTSCHTIFQKWCKVKLKKAPQRN